MLRNCLIVSTLLFMIFFSACGANKKIRGPFFLELAPINKKSEGFTHGPGGELIFEAFSVRFSLTPLRSVRAGDPRLIQALMTQGFVIIDMEITNMTTSDKVMFNPSMSSLMDNKLHFKKPLEFTALYRIAMRMKMERTLNRELKGRFFDTNQIVRPGRTIRKFLIFTPFREAGKKAQLNLQEVYIGNKTIQIRFPFLLKDISKEK